MTKNEPKTYRIYLKKPSKLKKENLIIDIYIKLTKKEKELMDRQQLQVNSQQFMENTTDTIVETYCLTAMIENIIKPSKKKFEGKILVEHAEDSDKVILKRYMEHLLSETANHILKKKTVQEAIDDNK